jgi:hypothetical protein
LRVMRSKPGVRIGDATLVHERARGLAHVEMAREAELSMPSRRVVGRAGGSCRQEEAQCHEGCNKVCWHGRSFSCDAQRSHFFSMMISTRPVFWPPSGSSAPRGVALGATGRFRAVAGDDECQVPQTLAVHEPSPHRRGTPQREPVVVGVASLAVGMTLDPDDASVALANERSGLGQSILRARPNVVFVEIE